MLNQDLNSNIANNKYRLEVKTKKTGAGSEQDPVTTPIQIIVDWNNIENKPPLDNSGIGEVTALANTLNADELATAEVTVTKNETNKDLDFTFGIPRGKAGIVVSNKEPEDKTVVWLNPNGLGDDYVVQEDFINFQTEYNNYIKANDFNINQIKLSVTNLNQTLNSYIEVSKQHSKEIKDIKAQLASINERLLALEQK